MTIVCNLQKTTDFVEYIDWANPATNLDKTEPVQNFWYRTSFQTRRTLLSCDRFNFVKESVLLKGEKHRNGTTFYKNIQLIAYADDIYIEGC